MGQGKSPKTSPNVTCLRRAFEAVPGPRLFAGTETVLGLKKGGQSVSNCKHDFFGVNNFGPSPYLDRNIRNCRLFLLRIRVRRDPTCQGGHARWCRPGSSSMPVAEKPSRAAKLTSETTCGNSHTTHMMMPHV